MTDDDDGYRWIDIGMKMKDEGWSVDHVVCGLGLDRSLKLRHMIDVGVPW